MNEDIKNTVLIKDLKKIIERLPDDMPVVVDGHNSGMDCCAISIINIYEAEWNRSQLDGDFINESHHNFDKRSERKLISKALCVGINWKYKDEKSDDIISGKTKRKYL